MGGKNGVLEGGKGRGEAKVLIWQVRLDAGMDCFFVVFPFLHGREWYQKQADKDSSSGVDNKLIDWTGVYLYLVRKFWRTLAIAIWQREKRWRKFLAAACLFVEVQSNFRICWFGLAKVGSFASPREWLFLHHRCTFAALSLCASGPAWSRCKYKQTFSISWHEFILLLLFLLVYFQCDSMLRNTQHAL